MIELGKYAGTVLAAYGVTVLLLAGIVWHSVAANARARNDLHRQEGRTNG